MSVFNSDSLKTKNFHLLSELKKLAEKRAERLIKDYKASIRTLNSKQPKWVVKTSHDFFKDSRKNFISKFMIASGVIERSRVLIDSLVGVYIGMHLVEDVSDELLKFTCDCEMEYGTQARYFIESQFTDLGVINTIFLDEALAVLRELDDEKAEEYFEYAPIIKELLTISQKINLVVNDSKHSYSSTEFNKVFKVYLPYLKPNYSGQLKPLFDSVAKVVHEYFFNLTVKLDAKIIAQESLRKGSASELIRLMNNYQLIEQDFSQIIELPVIDKYSVKRENLEENLKQLEEGEAALADSQKKIEREKDKVGLITLANQEIESITNLIYTFDSRYQEFQDLSAKLITWKKSCNQLISTTLDSLLDLSLKVPVDYTGLKPENQFNHWRERIELLDEYLIKLSSVEKAIRYINKARVKLIMSGESYSIDLCRRYPKKTGDIKHHLEQYDAVINGVTGIVGTERVLGELEQQSEALRTTYYEFMLDTQVIKELLERVQKAKIKLVDIEIETIIKLVDYVDKYNGNTILQYPDIEKEWLKGFKFLQQNQTAVTTLLESDE